MPETVTEWHLRRPAFYPKCEAGHNVPVARNGMLCDDCVSDFARANAPTVVAIEGPLGPFLIPARPPKTREHAEWICRGVWAGEYDAPGLPESLSDGAVVLDIGSHCGAFAALARKRWGDVTIHGYDPNREACEIATQNVQGATFDAVAVTIDTNARYGLPEDWGSAKTHELGPADGTPVDVLSPADLPPATVIKVDAEGIEPEVLEHYQHWDGVQILIYEFHNLEHKASLYARAEALGFRNLREQDEGTYGASVWVRA